VTCDKSFLVILFSIFPSFILYFVYVSLHLIAFLLFFLFLSMAIPLMAPSLCLSVSLSHTHTRTHAAQIHTHTHRNTLQSESVCFLSVALGSSISVSHPPCGLIVINEPSSELMHHSLINTS